MRRLAVLAAVLAAGLALAGCNRNAGSSAAYTPSTIDLAKFEQQVEALDGSKPFKFRSRKTTDIPALLAALPPALKASYASVTSDQASGATVLGDVTLSLAANEAVGVRISELKVWDLDTDFAIARLSGQRLDETAPLARRVEATGVSLIGLETLIQPMFDSMSERVSEAVDGVVASSEGTLDDADALQIDAALDMGLERYNFSFRRLVIDDLVLRPFVLAPRQLEADSDWAEILPLAQSYAAFGRAFAADSYAAFDAKAELSYQQAGRPFAFSFTIGDAAAKGVRGGDLDLAYASKMAFTGDFPEGVAPEAATDGSSAAPLPLKISGAFDRYSLKGVRADKLYDHLARGVMPAKTETDLMSLGEFVMTGQSISLNGNEVYSVAESRVDLRGWTWLIPSNLSVETKDARYNLRAFMDFAASAAAATGEAPDLSMANTIIDRLAAYGLDRPSFDLNLGWRWNPSDGAARIDALFGVDDFMRMTFGLDGALPDYQRALALIADDISSVDTAGLSALFEETSAFSGLDFRLVDEGGLQKSFALAIDIAKVMPADDPSAAMLANQTPDNLRQMASAMVMMVGGAGSTEFPPAAEIMSALGTFIATGGELSIGMKPAEPLRFADAPAAAADLSTFGERMGLTVKHTPPPAQP
ncbi:hypothetical protein GC169_07670 [bacterium]|nr:hypothetical protein [bacterium]